MTERVLTAAGLAFVVVLMVWVIFGIAVLLDRLVPWWMPFTFGGVIFVILFVVDLITTAPKKE